MRIVAGRHRGRSIATPDTDAIRPTSDRMREALFNILASGSPSLPADARVLDVFAGTGALGLEALSRGAAFVTFIENDRRASALIHQNLRGLGEDIHARVVTRDAAQPGPSTGPAQLAFLDPPYGKNLAAPALAALLEGGWLADDARILVEMARDEDFHPPPGFVHEDERAYGKSRVVFLRLADQASAE